MAELEDLLSFLSTKENGAHFNEISRYFGGKGYEPILEGRGLHPKRLKALLGLAYDRELVDADHPPGRAVRGRKNVYRITRKGARYLGKHHIRNLWGKVGIEFAEGLFDQGYEIEFLSDLTGRDEHKDILFAWRQDMKNRDVKLCVIFPPKEFDKYLGFKVLPHQPVTIRSLKNYIIEKVADLGNREELSKALREYFDPDTHNAFFASIAPSKPIHFGIPFEVSFNPSYTGFLCAGFHMEPPPVEMPATFTVLSWPEAEHLGLQSTLSVNLLLLYKEATQAVCGSETLKRAYRARFEPMCKDAREDGYCTHYWDHRKCVMDEMRDKEVGLREAIESCEVLIEDAERVRKKRGLEP